MGNGEREAYLGSGRAAVGPKKTVAKDCRLVYKDGRLEKVFLVTPAGAKEVIGGLSGEVLLYSPNVFSAGEGPFTLIIPLPSR